MHLHNNTTLQSGKYKIVRFLSSGGFGNTYEGVHTMMDTRVAIKEFFPKMFCNRDENTSHVTVATQGNRELVDKLRKKFNEEAKAVFQMNHPNIVRVLDIFEENGTAYYVMEYIDGKSLNDITKEHGALPEAEAVGYIRQVADALRYVHSLNRLHLDIKPGNIMIDKNGKAILIDFGASKHYDTETGENTSTLMGVNTSGYAPAEQTYRGFVQFSASTDIYALGATLYKLLTGITPPDAQMLKDGEAELSPLPSGVSDSVKSAIKESMRPLRKDRPQSIEEFIVLLDKAQKNGAKEKSSKKPIFRNTKDSNDKAFDNESTLVDLEDVFSRDVKELCDKTGKSQRECEKALRQTKGKKGAALIKIHTEELYKKYGSAELGIGRGTCKKYIENAKGSMEQAETLLANFVQEKENEKSNKILAPNKNQTFGGIFKNIWYSFLGSLVISGVTFVVFYLISCCHYIYCKFSLSTFTEIYRGLWHGGDFLWLDSHENLWKYSCIGVFGLFFVLCVIGSFIPDEEESK